MKKLILLLLCAVAVPSVVPAQMLIENFRNFDCANCKPSDEAFEKFILDHPEYNATIIYYHNRDPFTFDPFFLAAKEDVLSRNSLYVIPGNPTVMVSGYWAGTGGDKLESWKSFATDASQIPSPASTEITRTYNGDSTFTVTVTYTGSSVNAEVRPLVLLTESGIIEPNNKGYGLPTSGVWDNIFRDSLPPTSGGGPFILQGSKAVTFTMDTRGKKWKWENLKAVAFLQSTAMFSPKSYPIIGVKATAAGFFSESGVQASALVEISNAFPNPFSSGITIPFSLKKAAHVKVRITDALGRVIATVLDANISELNTSVTYVPQSLVAGTYVASIYVDGTLAATQKLFYNP